MKTKSIILAALLATAAILSSCRRGETPQAPAEVTPEVRAAQLAQEILIIDTHIDLPYRLYDAPEDVAVETEDGHFDAIRAREGGLDAAFMSIYVPAKLQDEGGARELADELIDLVERPAGAGPRHLCRGAFRPRCAHSLRSRHLCPADGDRKRRRHRR